MPQQLSFNLTPAPGVKCHLGHEAVHHITGRDQASQQYLSNWAYWCAECQALVMTREQTQAATQNLADGAVGFVAAVPLHLRLTAR